MSALPLALARRSARRGWSLGVATVAAVAVLAAGGVSGPASAAQPVDGPSRPLTAPPGPCDGLDAEALADGPAIDAIDQIESLSAFGAAVGASGIDLSVGGPFTIFAPTNDAIDAIPQNVFDAMLADQDLLAMIIGHHIVVGQAIPAVGLVEAGRVETLNGPLDVAAAGAGVTVGDANVLCPDLVTADGVVIVIDRVLQPQVTTVGACPGGPTLPGSSLPASSVPASSVPGASVPC